MAKIFLASAFLIKGKEISDSVDRLLWNGNKDRGTVLGLYYKNDRNMRPFGN